MGYRIKITLPSIYQQPSIDGQVNPVFFEIMQAVARSQGIPEMHVLDNKDGTCSQTIYETEYLQIDKCLYLLSLGGEVENYPAFIKLDTDPATTDSIYTYKNEEGVEVALTWEEWLGGNTSWREVEGFWYGPTHPNGKALPISEISNIIGAGIEVINVDDYKEILSSVPPLSGE
jgi:hypothetical protein